MSSAAYLKLSKPIKRDEWLSFCEKTRIEFSPHTICQNVFYRGDTEIKLRPNDGILPRKTNGQPDFENAAPPEEATSITVSTFWMGNLEGVAEVVHAIQKQWPVEVEFDPELKSLIEQR